MENNHVNLARFAIQWDFHSFAMNWNDLRKIGIHFLEVEHWPDGQVMGRLSNFGQVMARIQQIWVNLTNCGQNS